MARKRTLKGDRPDLPRYVPKSKGRCGVTRSGKSLGGCGEPVYKRPVRYKKAVWHTMCLIDAIREGKV